MPLEVPAVRVTEAVVKLAPCALKVADREPLVQLAMYRAVIPHDAPGASEVQLDVTTENEPFNELPPV